MGSMCTDRYLRTMLGTKKAYCYIDEVLLDLMIHCCYMVNFCDTAVPRQRSGPEVQVKHSFSKVILNSGMRYQRRKWKGQMNGKTEWWGALYLGLGGQQAVKEHLDKEKAKWSRKDNLKEDHLLECRPLELSGKNYGTYLMDRKKLKMKAKQIHRWSIVL